MGEGLLARARRVVEAGVDHVAADRPAGGAAAQDAIRDIDDAIARLRREHDFTRSRGAHAADRRRLADSHAAKRREEARFALSMGREDLAAAALAARLRAQEEADVAGAAVEAAEADICRLTIGFDILRARRRALADALGIEAGTVDGEVLREPAMIDRRAGRAEVCFATTLTVVAGGGPARDEAATADELRRERAVARELAAIRAELFQPNGSEGSPV